MDNSPKTIEDAIAFGRRQVFRELYRFSQAHAPKPRTLEEIKEDAVWEALNAAKGNKSAAARRLGITVKTIASIMRRRHRRQVADWLK